MKTLIFTFLFCFGVALTKIEARPESEKEHLQKQKLIVFLFGGFRWDYVDQMPRGSLPGFDRLQREGSRAEGVRPIFPSLSYPSWTTLSTGLYAENHNIIGDYMYDFKKNEAFQFLNATSTQRAHWWTSAEPIWTTATRQGKKVGLFSWPRCDLPEMGIQPAFCDGFVATEGSKVLEKNLGKAVDFLEEEDYDMVMLYNEHLGYEGHQFGPNTKKQKEVLRVLDEVLYRLMERIRNSSLKDHTNIMVVSDHGMADVRVSSGVKYLNLTNFVDPADIHLAIDIGAIMGITPMPGKTEEVYNELKRVHGINVYTKEEIPEEYHYKKGIYVQDILLVAERGFFINPFPDNCKQMPAGMVSREMYGFRGYPPFEKDMWTVFFGWGPAFKSHYRGGHLELVDIYQMYAHIIGVHPRPHNGSWERVSQYLTGSTAGVTKSIFVIFSAFCLVWF